MRKTRDFTPTEKKAMAAAATTGRGGDCNNPEHVLRELGLHIVLGPLGTKISNEQ